MWRLTVILLLPILLAGCAKTKKHHLAPVVEGWEQASIHSGYYRVKAGDTLYSIAWGVGVDYRALAAANQLKSPYRIHPGQTLRTRVSLATAQLRQPAAYRLASHSQAVHKKRLSSHWHGSEYLVKPVKHWRWPARGRVVERYSPAMAGNKGIDIAGRYGEAVRASAPGVVVYSGAGVRGYGRLIILKHNANYLSAYAFNKRILVREGSRVRYRQKIAEMGRDNSGRVVLHFEIRLNGKPMNPLPYLS